MTPNLMLKILLEIDPLGGNREQKHSLGRVFLPEFLDIVDGINLFDHIKSLSDQFLLDDLQEFVLLESFTRDIQWEIIRIDDTANELKIFWHHIGEIIGDENTSDVHLNIVLAKVIGNFIKNRLSTKAVPTLIIIEIVKNNQFRAKLSVEP